MLRDRTRGAVGMARLVLKNGQALGGGGGTPFPPCPDCFIWEGGMEGGGEGDRDPPPSLSVRASQAITPPSPPSDTSLGLALLTVSYVYYTCWVLVTVCGRRSRDGVYFCRTIYGILTTLWF